MPSATQTHLTNTDLERFKQLLLQEQQKTLYAAENLNSRSVDTEQLKHHHNDLAENGTACHTLEKVAFLGDRSKQYLKSIQKALERISNGTFGICIFCGRTIPTERLEAVPHTTLCVNCKAKNGE